MLSNSRRALALAEYARDHGQFAAVHRLLFEAYFVAGANLADTAVLRDVAQRGGLDPDAALAAVDGGEYDARIDTASAEAREIGITGVPTFIVADRYAIVGAQPYEWLRDALRQIAAEMRDEA